MTSQTNAPANLLDLVTDGGIADSDTARGVSNAFAAIGKRQGDNQNLSDEADRSRGNLMLAHTASNAYVSAIQNVAIDDDMLISCMGAPSIKTKGMTGARLAFAASLQTYSDAVDILCVQPAVQAWLAKRDASHPLTTYATDEAGNILRNTDGSPVMIGYISSLLADLDADTKLSDERRKAAEMVRQGMWNVRSLMRAAICIAPVIDTVRAELEQPNSRLTGNAGLKAVLSAVRKRIDARVADGRLFTAKDVEETAREACAPALSDTPSRDRACGLAKSIRNGVDALAKLVSEMQNEGGRDGASVGDLETVRLLVSSVTDLGFKPGEKAFPWREMTRAQEEEAQQARAAQETLDAAQAKQARAAEKAAAKVTKAAKKVQAPVAEEDGNFDLG